MNSLDTYLQDNPDVYSNYNPLLKLLPDIPVIELAHKKYLEYIKWDDIPFPVMRYLDENNINYIILKLVVNKRKILQIFYQLYCSSNKIWGDYFSDKFSTNLRPKLLNCTSKNLTIHQLYLLKKIITNRTINITYKHKCPSDIMGEYHIFFNLDKNYILLIGKYEIDACLVIQRYWKLCRYNPSYYICRKIHFQKLKNII